MVAKVETAIASGDRFADGIISIGGIKYKVGINVPENRPRQFFPLDGPGVISIHKKILSGIKDILISRIELMEGKNAI